ncbi:MAG: DUF4347 domain-containing protein, partial [Nitrospira sp.]|nr:DUF4347 domain-containing protein [Nitrospira sp.]
MFDAAAAATASEVNQEQVAQEQAEAAVSSDSGGGETQESADSQALLRAITTYMPVESRHEVVFVDPTVPNYQELLSGMDLNVEVIMLDGGQDGIEQMATALAGRTGIDAIHIISQGAEGQLTLGTGLLTQDSISTQYAALFQQIGQSLSADADLLIYGSNFGHSDAGQAAIQTLATLTGADVAASTDQTGSIAENGNWNLEVSTGSIETGVVIGAATQETWDHVLTTTPSETTTSDGDHLLVAPDSPTTARQELVFVDTAVEDYQSLLVGISPNAEIIILDSTRDGVQQISEALQGRHNLDAIHILSHGVDGALELGSTWLNSFSLEARADTIAQWGQSLSADADILLYGCNVAENAEGRDFVNRLAELTGADVAASQDATGNAALGADWNLEYSTGSIESESAVDAETQQDWDHVMAITAGTSTSAATASGTTASSLTWSHTVGAGSNGILIVDVSMYTTSGITVSSITYGGTALTYIGSDTSSKDHVEMWYLKAPETGTANIVVTLTGSTSIAAGATNFFGVDQTTSYGSLTTGNGSGDPSITVASATGELVVDAVSDRDVDSESVGAGQTVLLTNKAGTNASDAWVGSSTEAGAASVTMSWTTSGGGAGEWAAVAVSLKPFINDAPVLADTALTLIVAEDAGAPSGAVGSLISAFTGGI